MTTFRATFDANALNKQLETLSRLNQFGAFSRALSRAGQTMRKQAITEAQGVLNLKAGPIRDVVNVKRVGRGDLSADLVITARGLGLHEFKGTRRTARRGLSVQVKKTSGRKYVRSGFLATMRSGKALALRRRFKNGESGKQYGRLPVDVLYSTSVRDAFEDRIMQRVVLNAGLVRFSTELGREVRRRLGAGG